MTGTLLFLLPLLPFQGLQLPDSGIGWALALAVVFISLQDVHWISATIGGVFQGYTLGNIMAAQFFAKAKEAHPDIPQQIQEGEFKTLHGWLKDNIYQHGSKFTPDELLQRVTGGPLSTEPYMDYLWGKFQPMYDLRDAERAAEATAG
jgi:hypothetical protein